MKVTTVAVIANNGANVATSQPSGMGRCGKCKTVPVQHVDHTPGEATGRYTCKCPEGHPRFPLIRASEGT